jgi:saccharopine dehydrogenase-like NADP-dependent oxidoreductase
MKIVVLGGAGAMGRTAVRDLSENSEVKEILIADLQEAKAKEFAASFQDFRIKGAGVDANKVEETANVIKGYDTVINTAMYFCNISVMRACLKAECHYNDLGGFFHTTREQLGLFDDFKKAGLTAVLGIGVAPGTTNVLSRYGYDRLDEVEKVHLSYAVVDITDMKGIDVFQPGYSLVSIMREFCDEAWAFIDGEYKAFPPGSEPEEIVYPEPIGKRTCIYTLHSEPATIPASYKDKGVKEVTWKLGLPPGFEERARFLASLGFGSSEPVIVRGVEVIPLEVLAVVTDKQVREKLAGVELELNQVACARAQVIGKKNGRKTEYIVDSIARTPHRLGDVIAVGTGVPPSITAQMQVKGMIKEPGVWGPEQVIAPEYFFSELARREIRVQVTMKEDLA